MLTKAESKEVKKAMLHAAAQIKASNPEDVSPMIKSTWNQLRPRVKNKMVYKAFHDTMMSFI